MLIFIIFSALTLNVVQLDSKYKACMKEDLKELDYCKNMISLNKFLKENNKK